MTDSDIRHLPPELAARSLSPEEIVLPWPEVLTAIDHLERTGVRILGWEGWLRHPDGTIGHAREQGTVDLSTLTTAAAADLCRRTIRHTQERVSRGSGAAAGVLHFCITLAAS